MPKTLYKQCRLVKTVGTTKSYIVTYLPVKYAKTDNILKLCGDNGKWTDGWRVLTVFGQATDEPDVNKTIRNHRLNTGDATKK